MALSDRLPGFFMAASNRSPARNSWVVRAGCHDTTSMSARTGSGLDDGLGSNFGRAATRPGKKLSPSRKENLLRYLTSSTSPVFMSLPCWCSTSAEEAS